MNTLRRPSPCTRLTHTVGIDLGDRQCHLVVVTGIGGRDDITVVEQDIIKTTPDAVRAWFAERDPMRVVVEVGTPARWIAAELEALGHEVIVCNPRNLPEIYNNPRKSDFVDAESLARTGHTDAARLVQLVDFTGRDVRALNLVRARDGLVKGRTRFVNHVRGVVKAYGARLPACEGRRFHLLGGHVPAELRDILWPLFDVIATITEQITALERHIREHLEARYPDSGPRLQQLYGIGPVISLYFLAVVGDPNRFSSAERFASYLGLVPRRRQSGELDPHLGISKAGAPLLRALLVGAARDFASTRAPDSALKDWARGRMEGATRYQRKRITVGLARKLGVLMWHLLKTDQDFIPYPQRSRRAERTTELDASST